MTSLPFSLNIMINFSQGLHKVDFLLETTSKFREFMSPAIIVYYLISINFDSKNARKMPKLK